MSIRLFEHNQTAYLSALTLLAEKGKAAVIHPTGTGKSFIGFKLCEDHPGERVCWLSPSEYIFRTQEENLRSSGAEIPENIQFFTYAKLMLMQEEELKRIRPGYIVLDEFHRCGAEMWGQGVQRLLTLYPEALLLGLSATNIRYLDNRRDMADELFDGKIASQMTLGEAIVRGILTPPKYVLSVYAYQKELERYAQRAQGAKSRAVREQAGAYLEALRRALEQAEGLEDIFARHMQEKHGKYLVFCANVQHMREMIEKVPEWFSGIDSEPHIYRVYTELSEADRAFRGFQEDESDHLKLLFCIDMLNEGVHVNDVSGVILLRPTVSPIIYKQQIGRALSAGRKETSVIFDIVMNISNLCSIGQIEEEMQIATAYYRDHGMSERIVREHFRVTDEVRDCVELFQKLNETLSGSWELMYGAARRYYEQYGDLRVTRRYVTPEGFALGAWLNTQRRIYAGKVSGMLSEEQIAQLNAIGMRWQSADEENWEKYFGAAQDYYRVHGNLVVPAEESYRPQGNPPAGTCDKSHENPVPVEEKSVPLGRWLAQLRASRKSGIRSNYLTPERIRALDAIGMVWDVPDYLWEQNYHSAVQYHRQHGNLEVPGSYVDDNGVRLGAWLSKLRGVRRGDASYKGAELTEEQISRLDALGMEWESRQELSWQRSYRAVCRYKAEHGNIDIPASYISSDGLRIGRWIRHQREAYRRGISEERKKKLGEIGFEWKHG